MADQSVIDAVKVNLPSWTADVAPDWDDAKVNTLLDLHSNSVPKVVRLFWLGRVNDATALTDISDVGASRPLSQLYQHAQDMLRYWDKIAGEGSTASSIGKIKRRYPEHRTRGLNPYGGVYVRTD